MGDYFKPLRRKTGVVTLMLALALVVGWVRSYVVEDKAVFPVGRYALLCDSLDCFFICGIVVDATPGELPPFPMWQSRHFCSLDQCIARASLRIKWQQNGFGVGEMYCHEPFQVWIIPYWSLVVPLTLLSVALLLSWRPKSIQKKTDEPIAHEGA